MGTTLITLPSRTRVIEDTEPTDSTHTSDEPSQPTNRTPTPENTIEPPSPDLHSNSTNSTTPTKTDKRYGDTISPHWFYDAKMRVECPSVDNIMTLDMSGIDRSLFPGSEDLILPVRYQTMFETREQAADFILAGVADCKDCDCLEDGSMIPNWFRLEGTGGNCNSDRVVSICQLIYGCYCSARLIQRLPTATGVTADDYQAALDQIPWSVRVDPRNIGYWWKNAPVNAQGRRAWMKAPGGYVPGFTYGREPPHKILVPGTAEPYYLEGPDDGTLYNVDRGLLGSMMGVGGLGGKSSLGFVKRDDTTPANLGDGENSAGGR
ncbi:hypothetical protein TWF481_005353 [Arthrobotrys musiformis]|uniref:Uncharacterized protein n=1 Tax=Arthrobotrys musiformis TaxID=47236 RepID=A0AAV9WDG6_9PEZI